MALRNPGAETESEMPAKNNKTHSATTESGIAAENTPGAATETDVAMVMAVAGGGKEAPPQNDESESGGLEIEKLHLCAAGTLLIGSVCFSH